MHKKTVLIFIMLKLFLLCNSLEAASPPGIISHQLHISIDLKKHSIRGSDLIHIETHDGKIIFQLREGLKIKSILLNGKEDAPFNIEVGEEGNQVVILKEAPPSKAKTIFVEYEGEIHNPVEKSETLNFVAGDHTDGIISQEGVFLSGETLWYPTFKNVLSLFEIRTEIDGNYTVITQEDLLSTRNENGKSLSQWKSHVPAEGLVLIAGKYFVHSRKVDGVEISTYFFEDNEDLAEKYIQKCAEYIRLYSGILGPYPYRRFSVVENFFSTGYGFPSITLLGSGVIQRGEEALRPGYLDHEIVHSWWGNYVYNDFRKGNWVEALTTYCANYYYKELKEGSDAAALHRKEVSVSYSLDVVPEREYPANKFQGKAEEVDGDIGYGKGSMIFHQLRRTVGDEVFWGSLRELVRRYGGRYAEWGDIRSLFEEKSGKELRIFFEQWLERKGGPKLSFENMNVSPVKEGYKISGSVVQSGEIYNCQVPVQIDFGSHRQEIFDVELKGWRNAFHFDVRELPVSVRLDPGFHLFRLLEPEEISPNLNATLADHQKVFFIGKEEDDAGAIYRSVAERAIQQKGGRIAAVAEDPEEVLKSHSVFFMGKIFFDLKASATILKSLPSEIKLEREGFELKGKKFKGPEYSILISIKNPYDAAKTITFYYGLGIPSLQRAKYIFYYGKDGYLIYQNGKPIDRGEIRICSPLSFFHVPDF